MTSINAAGPSMQMWMVQALFGTSDQASATISTAAPSSTASSPIIAASLKMAPVTGAAVAKLGSRDSAPDADPLAWGLDQKIADDKRANAVALSNSKMSSTAVEADMYGAGIPAVDPTTDDNKPTISFTDLLNRNRIGNEQTHQYFLNTPELSGYLDQECQQYNDYNKFLDAITAAYQNHTLVFQNASDVQGLDYSRWSVATSGAGVSSANGGEKYNQDWYINRPDKDHSRMMDTGGNLTLYVTW